MKLIGRFVFHIFANAIALLAAGYFIKGFILNGGFIELLVAAAILTLINTFIRPILKLLLGPLIILTLGLFLIVINAISLYLLDLWSEPLTIEGYTALLLGTLIVSAANLILNLSAKTFKKNS